MNDPDPRSPVRLAELVATLSLGTDLGLGQPMEHVLRQCLIALRLGELFGLDESERQVLYYSGLLAWVGCFRGATDMARQPKVRRARDSEEEQRPRSRENYALPSVSSSQSNIR
jgi:hypothetical protein